MASLRLARTGDTQAGFANCWIRNWTSESAYPEWQIEFLQSGQYQFSIEYSCRPENVGCELQLDVGEQSLQRDINLAHSPPLQVKPDRIYSNNYQDKSSWAVQSFGTLEVRKGRFAIQLRTKLAGDEGVELNRITIRAIR